MRRILGPARVLVAVLLVLAAALPAAGWEVRPDAPEEAFEAFHGRFATAAYHYPRHGASPLGLVGFDVYVDLAADQDFDDEPFYDQAVAGDLPADVLAVSRVGARKGLPGGIDLGASYAWVLDSDMKLLSADLQWAILDGGLLSPALSLRLTGTRSLDDGVYQLEQYGAELLLSKGFTVLTPYVGAGMAYSEGTLERLDGTELSTDDTQAVFYGGVTLNLLLPKITVEVEKGEAVQAAVKVAFGF
ncbi:MAG TPA: hypothetical protein VHQ65_16745 [Thermoanaerobaculia bacterium]|nr:hypothetical protein [Thermoanaerobaculia bacterium]